MQKFYCEGEDGLLDKLSRTRYDGLSSSCGLNTFFESPPSLIGSKFSGESLKNQ